VTHARNGYYGLRDLYYVSISVIHTRAAYNPIWLPNQSLTEVSK